MAGKAFSGGEKLEAYLRELAAKIAQPGTLEVGFMEDATYPDGTPVALIAAMNEFGGDVTIPEHEVTLHRKVNKEGDFLKGGRFVKHAQSNFETTHLVPEHTVTIPPRPYFRGMVQKESGHWGSDIGKLLKANDYDAPLALAQMGELIQGELQESIRDFSDPQNASSTIAQKGFNDPLIESGHMMNSTSHRVTK
ncbi:hypothetical protein [Paraburkholderia sp. MM6662-R1]|uniref:hypothetical protein n=1 Tax=Paraburkholderia sp. MM6662-R1 TaxID=2991066 RepID=UPI003D258E44